MSTELVFASHTTYAPGVKSGSGPSRWCAAALLAVSGWGCSPSSDPIVVGTTSTAAPDPAQHAKDSIIVRYRATPTAPSTRGIAMRVAGAIDDRNNDGIDDRFAHIANGRLAVIRLGDQVDVDTALDELRKDPAILYAERNYILRIAATPNDARFSELYGMHNTGQTGGTPDADIDAPEAWDSTIGSSDVVIGVVDTGVDYRHEDLAANMWVNPGEIPDNGTDDDGNGVVDDVHGFNAIAGSGDPFDDNNHGTHTSGTIGAAGDNGIGVAGVSWTTQIMAIKFLAGDGWGTTADAIRAIDYAVAQKLAGVNLRVLSNSWGGDGFSQALLDAIVAAGDAGILFVAAAGNNSGNNDVMPYYPASYEAPNLVSVAATDHDDALAWFSNFGATSVDLGAPGMSVLSTTPNHQYQFMDGTSMATPHVAGVAALALSVNASLTVDELKQLLLSSGDPIPALDGLTVTGRRLNAAAAIAQAGPAVSRFTMSVASPRQVVPQQAIATYTVDIRSVLGFAGPVELTVSSEPPIDAAVAITPVVTAPGNATLTVATSGDTALGSYKLTITGRSGALVASRIVALRVLAPGTLFEINMTPARQAVLQESGASFHVAVDAVGGFTGEVGLSLTSQPAFPGAAYLVRGVVSAPGTTTLYVYTDCATRPGDYVFTVVGTGEATTASAAATLTVDPYGTITWSVPSADTPLVIPDVDPAGVASTIDIVDDVSLRNLSVTVNITHTAIGDLVVQLVGPDSTPVTLHDRAGGDDDNLRRTYTVRDFAGRSSTGPWRLRVSDLGTAGTGTLESWELNPSGPPRSFPPSASFEFFVDGQTVEFVDYSFGTGCGGGSLVVSRLWDFGDGATSTDMNVQHTYAALGDYVVTLTVTDEHGLTDSTQQIVTVTRPPPVLSIQGVTRDRARSKFWVDLRWSGAQGHRVELFRNWASVAVLWNDGRHRDEFRGQDTAYWWYLCEQPGLCSNTVSIDFGPNTDASQATIRTLIGGKQIIETIAIEDEE